MASSKSSSKTRSRKTSSKKTSSKTASRKTQTARTAGDNEPGAALTNELGSSDHQSRQPVSASDKKQLLDPKVQKAILGVEDGEPLTSVNSLRKDEGGLPADEIARLRSVQESVVGARALGQPGQTGHGVGTYRDDTPLTDEDREANEKEYARRTKLQ